MTKSSPATFDEYLSGLNKEMRAALEKLRKVVKSTAPGSEECFSNGMPAFRYRGRMLVRIPVPTWVGFPTYRNIRSGLESRGNDFDGNIRII